MPSHLLRRVLPLVAAALLALPPAALAHEGVPGVRVVLGDVPDALDDLEIDVGVSVAAQVVLANPTDEPVEVLNDDGVAFLRIGPQGVEANLDAAEWYRTNDPFGSAEPPPEATDGVDEPRWARVSREPSWGWFDHRLHPEGVEVPPGVLAAREPTQLATWGIPLRYRGEVAEVRGRVEYRPVRGSFGAALTRGEQPFPDVTVAVLQGRVPGLFLDNKGTEPVVVLGAQGEPFLRIGPDGVEANAHSPSWVDAARARGETPSAPADPAAPPVWEEVAQAPRYAWLELRAVYPDEEPPADLVGQRADLVEWQVPLRRGEDEAVVAGVTTWVPVAAAPPDAPGEDGAAGSAALRLGLGLAAAAAMALVVVRGRGARR